MREEWNEQQKEEDIKRAMEEAKKEQAEDAEAEKERQEEEAYDDLLVNQMAKLGLITTEELDKLNAAKKKKR